MAPQRTDTEVVVVGAGQAGLSVAYYLRRLGLQPGSELVILDRGPAEGGAWQFRWDALRLGSAHRVNDLPGMTELGISFDTADRSRPAREVVAEYYRRYERHFDLRVRRPLTVTRVENAGTDLAVRYTGQQGEEGRLTTQVLVNATGTWGSPFVPWYPGMHVFRGRHVHTADYRSAENFTGQSVVVVGGGTSAIGFLLELENVAAELTWVSRRPIDWMHDQEQLTPEAGVMAERQQDVAARAGRALPSIVSGTRIPVTRRIQAAIDRGLLVARPMFTAVESDGVRFADGSVQHADAIIWATGFRPELRHLAPLKLRDKAGGVMVGQHAAGRDPRIFFAGYGPTASTIGANRAGRAIARQVVATLSRMA